MFKFCLWLGNRLIANCRENIRRSYSWLERGILSKNLTLHPIGALRLCASFYSRPNPCRVRNLAPVGGLPFVGGSGPPSTLSKKGRHQIDDSNSVNA